MSDQILKLKGWDYDQTNGYETDKLLEFNYEEAPSYAKTGRVISTSAAHEMVVKKFWTDVANTSAIDKTIAVTFSKRLLLLILSQQKCEGIRFYFCKRPIDPNNPGSQLVRSLVLVGVDEHKSDLGAPAGKKSIFNDTAPVLEGNPQETIMEEVGEHLVYSDIEAHVNKTADEGFVNLSDFDTELIDIFQKLLNTNSE